MWFVRKVGFSYAALWIVSLVTAAQPVVQRGLALLWLAYVITVWLKAKQSGHRFRTVVTLTFVSQLPSIVLATVSIWSVTTGRLGEWPNGLMEVWLHPFVPWFELLPARKFGLWSDMYVAMCLIPAVILILCGLCWTIGGKRRSWG